MGRRQTRLTVSLVGVVLVAAVALGLFVRGGTDAAEGGIEWYLAVGDSLAAGVQPSNEGDGTDRDGGYAGLVREQLGEIQGTTPELTNLGCPGETTATLADGGLCSYPEGSQLAAARAFLAEQPGGGATGLVTVQAGANDVLRCLTSATASGIDEACVSAGLSTVRDRLPQVLTTLRDAAPRARVVVLDYYNPFSAAALFGPQGQPLATRSEEILADLNTVITEAAAAGRADVADVQNAFSSDSEQICELTWMCDARADIHATDAGYEVMADVVLEELQDAG